MGRRPVRTGHRPVCRLPGVYQDAGAVTATGRVFSSRDRGRGGGHGTALRLPHEAGILVDPIGLYQGTRRISNIGAGALPDAITFTANGSWALVANEGEPSDVMLSGKVAVVCGYGDVGKGWFFRNCYTDDFQGKYLASYVVPKLLGKNSVAIFYENNDYAIGLKDSFMAGAKSAGVKVTGAEAYMKGTADFTPQLTKLLRDKPDTIFLCGYHPEGALIAGQARKLGFNGPLFGADGIDNEDYIKIGGKATDNTYCTVPFLAASAGAEGQAFAKRFKEAYGRDVDWMSANAYDCLGILAQVIAKTGADRKKIREGLAAINSEDNGYKGITGLTYFDKKGDCAKPAFVKMVKDGKFVAAE